MALLNYNPNKVSETKKTDFSKIKLLYPNASEKSREEIIYRKNGKSIDKLIEFDANTGLKIKTTHYDYFDDKKVRSIDEYDRETGKKIRTINYVLYKSIDEYDIKSGKKIRTINFNIKDESKISSIQDYDIETGNIITITIYKRDGKTIGIVKNINPDTGKVTNWINQDKDYTSTNIPKYNVRSYDNITEMGEKEKENIANLIDNLYKNNMKFENIN